MCPGEHQDTEEEMQNGVREVGTLQQRQAEDRAIYFRFILKDTGP